MNMRLTSTSQTDLDDGLRVWRSFQMGKLMDLIILDTRNYDRSITSLGESINYLRVGYGSRANKRRLER